VPVIAVVAAYVAVSAAIATTTIFTVIAAVGAVVTAVGAVTGNEKLMKIGAVIGIVGAIGGFASGAFAGASDGGMSGAGLDGAAGDAAAGSGGMSGAGLDGAAGDAATNSTGMLNAPVEAPPVVPPTEVAPVASGPAEVVTTAQAPTATPTATGTAVDATKSLEGVTGSGMVDAPLPDPTANFIDPNNAAAGQNVSSSLNIDTTGGSGTGAISQAAKAPAGAFDKLTDMFSGLGKFVANNKDLSQMVLSGIQSAADPSQRDLREAQTASLNANAAATDQLRRNGLTTNRVDFSRAFRPPSPAGGMLTQPPKGR
jgi:hypothetical protein